MKFKFLFIVLFFTSYIFSQSDIYYFKDSSSVLTYESIKEKEFSLLKEQILDKHSNDVYWFKIPSYKTDSKYVFRIIYERYNNANVYQNGKKIEKLSDQRFLSYKFSRDYDVYIEVNPHLHSYIPVELTSEEASILKNNNQLLLNGFYYGFAFLVIIYNLCYYLLFKDDTFLYYSLFLATMTFGVFTMDGMLNFYNISESTNNYIMIFNYIFLAFFSSKFINHYSFLDNHFPKLKNISYVVGAIIIIFGFLYLNFKSYYYLLTLSILVFSLLLTYWFTAVLLFNKNVYTKILVFAYTIILFSGIDYFVLKFMGISIADIDPLTIKIGAFFEMIILSVAVLYRMKILKEENMHMRNEIVNYSQQLINLTLSDTQKNKYSIEELSQRERQIFNLIVLVKTNKEIANELIISVNTVKFHIKNIYEKLNIKSRREAQNLKDFF